MKLTEKQTNYDLWFKEKVHEALADQRPTIPHQKVMEEAQALIDSKRKAYLHDAKSSWDEYQKTGLHLSMEEADNWLAQLEAGNDVDPPKAAE